jgi:FKBP12-rapamycin complex-associated protein
VGGEEIAPSVDKVMSLVIEMLGDQTSVLKRDAALKTLGQVASNTGCVVDPYQRYPTLLGTLMRLLKTEKVLPVRRETIRTMGILGALDPYRHKVCPFDTNLYHTSLTVSCLFKLLIDNADDGSDKAVGTKVTDVMLLMNTAGASAEEYYQTVAISGIVNVLNDATQNGNHWAAIEAFMLIFKTQGLKCVPYLPQVSTGCQARRLRLSSDFCRHADHACVPRCDPASRHVENAGNVFILSTACHSHRHCETTHPELSS